MEQPTLSLRPFRFLHDFLSFPVLSEAIIIKRMFVPQRLGGEDHLLYGTLARTSGSSGSQILLANALDLPTEARDIPFPLNPLELAIHYTTTNNIETAEAMRGKRVEALVNFLRNFQNVAYSRKQSLWVNIGHGCCSYLAVHQT